MGKAKNKHIQKKTGAGKKFLIGLGSVLAAVLVVLLAMYGTLKPDGFFQRQTVSISSENHEIDNAVLSYYFFTQYQGFMNNVGSYASSFGLDSSKSLKTQKCQFLEDGTWYDYFMNGAVDQAKTLLAFCEEATARGISLTDEDHDEIDLALDSLEAQAKQAGVSTSYYISAMYGKGVKEKDLRRAFEMEALASKCGMEIVEGYSFGEADFDKYVAENPNVLLHYSYIGTSLSTKDGMAEGDITTDMLKDFETRFKAAATQEEFETVLRDYLKNYAYKDDAEMTDEKIDAEIAGYLVEGAVYPATETDFSKWANSAEGAVNTVYTSMKEDGTALDVYLLLAKPALQEYKSVNVRHILLTSATYGSDDAAKAKAEELLAQWQAGEKTAESFAALAAEYTEDSAKDGLYENVLKGQMVDEFNDWIFAEGRAAADTGIVKTAYGYHVMYMDGFGDLAWHVEAENKLMDAQYTKDSDEIKARYAVTVDEAKIQKLDA